MSDAKKRLVERIRARRGELRMTQQQVADGMGIPRATYADYEAGRNAVPLADLPSLATVLNCTVGFLFGEEAETQRAVLDDMKALRILQGVWDLYPGRVRTLMLVRLINKAVEDMRGTIDAPDPAQRDGDTVEQLGADFTFHDHALSPDEFIVHDDASSPNATELRKFLMFRWATEVSKKDPALSVAVEAHEE